MSLTRSMLKAMGIEAEKIDQIIDAHTDTVDALKKERDGFKEDAAKLPGVQKQLDDLKEAQGKDNWEEKYNAEHTAFEKFKADQTAKETKAAKEGAYRELLKEAGVSEKRINAVLRVTSLDDIELGTDGKIKDAAARTASIKEEWADFIVTENKEGANTPTPPANDPGGKSYEDMSMAEYIAARKK